HNATGFFGQVLQFGMHIVVRHHDRVFMLEQATDFVFSGRALLLRQLSRHAGPGVFGGASRAAFRLLVFHFLDGNSLHTRSSMRIEKSVAFTSLVNAPVEMRSTPVSASARRP